jgi:hypothetical protein
MSAFTGCGRAAALEPHQSMAPQGAGGLAVGLAPVAAIKVILGFVLIAAAVKVTISKR